MELTIEQRRERIKKWGTIGLIAAAGLIVSPIIFMAIQGLIGLAIAAVVGLTIVTFAPVVAMKFANWKLRSIKAEAMKNPIETLQNIYNEKRGALTTFKQNIESFTAQVGKYESELDQFKAKFPAKADVFEEQLTKMKQLLRVRVESYKNAKAELQLFDKKIEEADAMWKMSQSALALNKAAGMDIGDEFEKIKVETSLDSVELSMNNAFAQLETALMDSEDINSQLLIPNKQPLTIDVTPTLEKVRA